MPKKVVAKKKLTAATKKALAKAKARKVKAEKVKPKKPPKKFVKKPSKKLKPYPAKKRLDWVIRPEDHLVLAVELVNLKVTKQTPPQLVRMKPTDAGYKKGPTCLIVHFPPQNIAEEAFLEGYEALRNPPVRARLAGTSRLVFSIPKGWPGIDYSLEAVLEECQRLPLRVAPTAKPPPRLLFPRMPNIRKLLVAADKSKIDLSKAKKVLGGTGGGVSYRLAIKAALGRTAEKEKKFLAKMPKSLMQKLVVLREPKPSETALELPYRLVISPNKYAAWVHAAGPRTFDGYTELWHSRLAIRSEPGSGEKGLETSHAYLRTFRAIWAKGFSRKVEDIPPRNSKPFRMTIRNSEISEIVHCTSNYTGLKIGTRRYVPLPVSVRRLMLSSLGAWLKSRGAWETPNDLDLMEWVHRAAMGRDFYVRIVNKGYLFPFGHRAAEITITERKFKKSPSGAKTAYLCQRVFIVVREPEKVFGNTGLPSEEPFRLGASYDRQMPFKRVRITTLVTPDLKAAALCRIVDASSVGEKAYWPTVGNKLFKFHVVAEDEDGREVEFVTPLVFVFNSISHEWTGSKAKDPLRLIRDAYHSKHETERTIDVQGQMMAFADSGDNGDASLETRSVSLSAEVPANEPPGDQPRFFPIVEKAQVNLPVARHLTGDDSPCNIYYDLDYLKSGFDGNVGLYARLGIPPREGASEASVPKPLLFGQNGDKTGALVAPSISVTGLSRLLGPLAGDPSTLAGGAFDPQDFFKDAGGLLLGAVGLADIVKGQPGGLNLDKIPRFISQQGGSTALYEAEPLRLEFKFYPDLKSTSPPVFKVDSSSKLEVRTIVNVPVDGSEPSYEATATLTNFKLQLIAPNPFFIIEFKSVEFLSVPGKSPDVSADIKKITFAGPLSFVETLRDYIPLNGFVDPPAVDVTSEGITASFSLPIPTIAVGVFSLQNISLGAGFCIPFVSDPMSVSFNFCTRENPFLLTVMCFGGGGYFGLVVNPDGVHSLEAAFEFGASLALSFGVASGEVHIMAGIYFKLEVDESKLTGYLRMGGSLDVMGIISVSVELNMSLEYDTSSGKVWGRATLTIEVEVLFITVAVEVTLERRFAGSAGDPSFEEYMLPYPAANIYLPTETVTVDPWKEYCEAFA